MIKRKKKEEPLILYEKYKHDHHLNDYAAEKPIETVHKKSVVKQVTDLLLWLILIALVGLSVVGVLTLINPDMKALFIKTYLA